jgi:DNA-binding GntR family transcriptional regulator
MIPLSLLPAGNDDDAIPPRRPVPISISAIANRFGISRVHVRTVLRDAEAQGLIERTGKDGSQVLIRPELAKAVETYFAATFLFTAHCALQAAADARART